MSNLTVLSASLCPQWKVGAAAGPTGSAGRRQQAITLRQYDVPLLFRLWEGFLGLAAEEGVGPRFAQKPGCRFLRTVQLIANSDNFAG
jgi:hypothetical protein